MKRENKENIERVVVHLRIRPFNEEEIQKDCGTPFENINEKESFVCVRKDFDQKVFNYDTISNSNSKQSEIFEKTSKEIIDSVLNGYNGTILAYGQTGTGKTHTMVGDFEDNFNKGIIPRSFEYIFNFIENKNDFKYNVSLAFTQIYLETIQDLIETSNNNIKIREDLENGVYLDGVQWIHVKNKEECKKVFITGERNRAVASTKSNICSSRSHAILIIRIEKKITTNIYSNEPNTPSNCKLNNNISNLNLNNNQIEKNGDILVHKSQLFLVDLAGSERVKKSKAKALRLEEAKKINASLLILGNCIQALSDKNGFVPYRDSKLTRILQESLGGNAKTSLIITVSPSAYHSEETVCSLAFGQRAMKVQNKPMLNEFVDYENLCKKLSLDLDKLNDEYLELKNKYEKVVEENNVLKDKLRKKNPGMIINRDSKSLSFDDLEKSDQIIINNEEKEIEEPFKKIREFDSASAASSSSNSQSIESSDLKIIKEKYEKEIAKLENFYDDILKNKMIEHEQILGELNKKLNEKENELEQFKNDNIQIREKYNELVDIYHDSEEEKTNYKQMLLALKDEYEEIKLKLDQLSEKRNDLDHNKEDEVHELKYFVIQTESDKENTNSNFNNTKISNTINSRLNLMKSEKFDNNSSSLHKFNKDMTQKLLVKDFTEKERRFDTENITIETILSEEFLTEYKKPIKLEQSVQTANDSFREKAKEILFDKKFSLLKINEIISFDSLENCLEILFENYIKNSGIIKELKKENLEIKEETENQKVQFEKNKKRLITEYNEKIADYVKEINNLKNKLLESENMSKDKTNKLDNYLRHEIKAKEEENSLLKKSNNNLKSELNLNLDKIEKLIFELESKEKNILDLRKSEAENKKVKNQILDLKKIVNKFRKNFEMLIEKNICNLKNNDNMISNISSEFMKMDFILEKIASLKNNIFKFDHEKNKVINTINESLLNIHNDLLDIFKENNFVNSYYENNPSVHKKINTNSIEFLIKNFIRIPKNLNYLTFEESSNLVNGNHNKNDNASIKINNLVPLNNQISYNKNLSLHLNMNNLRYEEPHAIDDLLNKQRNMSSYIHIKNNTSEFDNLKSKSIPIKNNNPNSNDFHKSHSEEFLNKSIDANNDTIKKQSNLINSQDTKSINFESIVSNINNFFKLLNESKKKIYFSLYKLNEFIKFSIVITNIIKQKNDLCNNETKNISIELELAKKSEYYYRNRFIDFLQNFLTEISGIIPISRFEDIIFDLNKISMNICDEIAPELVEKSHKIIFMVKNKIDDFVNEKDSEIKSLNEKIVFFLKENQNYKKILNSTKTQNFSTIKNSYAELLNIKDTEINRLNDLINNLNEKAKEDSHNKCFTESRINIIEYREDLDKTYKNNISINLSEDIREHNINKTAQNEKDFIDFKNNISKYDNEILELRKTLKDNQFKHDKKEAIKSATKNTFKANKTDEDEVLKKSLYFKERLKKAVQKSNPDKRK